MFARSGTTPFVLGQLQAPLDQCGKLFLYGPLVKQRGLLRYRWLWRVVPADQRGRRGVMLRVVDFSARKTAGGIAILTLE